MSLPTGVTTMTIRTNRRGFLTSTASAGGALIAAGTVAESPAAASADFTPTDPVKLASVQDEARLPDLQPARWIWYPSARTLANTMVLFRRAVDLPAKPSAPPAGSSAAAATCSMPTDTASSSVPRLVIRASRKSIRWI